MTSQNKRNLNFKIPVPYDVVMGECKGCGKKSQLKYKLDIPSGKTVEYEKEYCFVCEKEKEQKELAEQVVKEYEEIKKRRMQKFFGENSLINQKLLNASFETYNPTNSELEKAKKICARYAENFSKNNPVNLLLFGTYGVGKSHLAVSIVKRILEKEFSTLFISTPKLLGKLRSTYNKDSDLSETQLIGYLNEVDCLVIDDLGAEKNSDWAMERLFEIIDGRSGKHTIYTTNFTPDDLKNAIGPRNFSRVMEDTHIIQMNGKDFRLKNF